ncbi:MAG: N-acetylmuramoyl-L-alanine amidase [Clostridia bacterium]|nr:N-acetylmuramoyl-L-alanine amidase [Clostridia bacterium]
MKRIFIGFVSLVFIFGCCLFLVRLYNKTESVSSSAENRGLYIILDAGHGGMDGGTSAADGTKEKDINLSIAKKLNSLLVASGYKTVMLRNDDALIGDNSLSTIRARKVSDIRKRLEIAESYPDSMLISIHQNYYSVPKYSGTQVFYSTNSPESKILAQSVQQTVVKMLQPNNSRKIKPVGSNIYLLYNCTIPAIMVECGFLSNVNEAQKLKTDSYQTQIALSIMQGITDYLE